MSIRIPYNFKKTLFSLTAASLLVLPVGCSKSSKDQSQAPSSTQSKESPNSSLSHSPSPSAADTEDQDLTKKLTSEKIVQSGRVYLAGNDAVAVITIKKGTDEKNAKDLAAKYANTMKQKYSNKRINTHAFIEGKEIAHITL